MYKRFGFLADFLLGSFFEIDAPLTINALLGYFSHFDSLNVFSWLHCPTVTVYIFRLSKSRVIVVTILYNSGSRNSKVSLIQPGFNKTSFFAYVHPWFYFYQSWQWCVLFGVLDGWHCSQISVFKALSKLDLTDLELRLVHVWYSEEMDVRRYFWHQNIPHY